MAVVERSPPTPSLDTHRWPACCRSLSDLSREEHEHVLVGDDGGDDNCPAARPLHCRQSRSRTRPAWCRTPTTGPAAGSARFTSCGSKRANGTLTAGTNTSASCWACVSGVGATGSATDSARIAPGGRRWWIPRPQGGDGIRRPGHRSTARDLGTTALSRLKLLAPATVKRCGSDAAGHPVLVAMAEPGACMAGEPQALLPQLRDPVGHDRRILGGFGRGRPPPPHTQ